MIKRVSFLILLLLTYSASLVLALNTDSHQVINEAVARNNLNGFSLNLHLKDKLGMSDGVVPTTSL
jgi:hypothetical protein